nr:unnamed protein product [Callosobruchus chinensis]
MHPRDCYISPQGGSCSYIKNHTVVSSDVLFSLGVLASSSPASTDFVPHNPLVAAAVLWYLGFAFAVCSVMKKKSPLTIFFGASWASTAVVISLKSPDYS